MLNKLEMILIKLFVLIGMYSCSNSKSNVKATPIEVVQKQELNICDLKQSSLKSIRGVFLNQPESVISSIKGSPSNEECIFEVIDKLGSAKSLNQDNLKALEALNDKSDGFLGEYFAEVAVNLFDESFLIFANFLYNNQNSSFVTSLTEGLSMELSMVEDGNRQAEKDKIISNTIKKMEQVNYSGSKKDFIIEMLRKIDPSLSD